MLASFATISRMTFDRPATPIISTTDYANPASRVAWAKARCSIARVGKIVHAPCPRGDGTANDFAHPTADLSQGGELQAKQPQLLARRDVIGLRVRLRRLQSVVELPGTSIELVRHREVENRLRSFLDGADRRDAALAHHGRGHVGRGMQTVRRRRRGIELACEIERKHDLGELALR